MRLRQRNTHQDGQPVIIELGVLKVFTQPLNATGEKKERQDPYGRDQGHSAAICQPAPFPSPFHNFQSVLTNSSNYQKLPKEQQQVCDFVQDHNPVKGDVLG